MGPYEIFDNPSYLPTHAHLSAEILALEWVQKHIIEFGGDPMKVTL
jgi:carboxylesterase type B